MAVEGDTPEPAEGLTPLMDTPPADDKPAADPASEESADEAPADAGNDPADPADGGDADGDAGGEEEEAEGAPEEYADFTAPEGVELDAEALDAFRPVAKELNLTQEQAQRLVDLQSQTAQRWSQQVQEHVTNTRMGWREASQNDKEFGGDKFQENLAVAKEGRDLFGDDELKTLLDETGIGDHPAVIRFFYKAGLANREHDFVTSGKPEKSKRFYDHPTS